MGQALHIPLSSVPSKGTTLKVTVYYKTTADCTALQWLDKEYVHMPSRSMPIS